MNTPHEYDDDCPDCQPAMVDVQTGQPFPLTHPYTQAIMLAFKRDCTLAERRAWHRVVMANSKNEKDMEIAQRVAGKLNDEILKVVQANNPA